MTAPEPWTCPDCGASVPFDEVECLGPAHAAELENLAREPVQPDHLLVSGPAYPLDGPRDEDRLDDLAIEVAHALTRVGFPELRDTDFTELREVLDRFVYGERP